MLDVVESVGKVIRIDRDKAVTELEEILGRNEHGEELTERFISYSHVLRGGNWTSKQYFSAVEYVTYRLMDLTMVESWMKTFPEKCNKPEGTIRASASIYDKGALVQKILAQVQIPIHVLMMNERMKAAYVLSDLMVNSANERIQMESADKLLTHVKVPESIKIEMDIGITTDDTIKEIGESLDKLALLAQSKIEQGAITPLQLVERR